MASRVGMTPWPGTGGKLAAVLRAIPAALSNRYTERTLDRLTERLVGAAGDFAPAGAAPH